MPNISLLYTCALGGVKRRLIHRSGHNGPALFAESESPSAELRRWSEVPHGSCSWTRDQPVVLRRSHDCGRVRRTLGTRASMKLSDAVAPPRVRKACTRPTILPNSFQRAGGDPGDD